MVEDANRPVAESALAGSLAGYLIIRRALKAVRVDNRTPSPAGDRQRVNREAG